MTRDTGSIPEPAAPWCETAAAHEEIARRKLNAAIALLDVFRYGDTLPTAATIGQLARLLEAAARHAALAEEWS